MNKTGFRLVMIGLSLIANEEKQKIKKAKKEKKKGRRTKSIIIEIR